MPRKILMMTANPTDTAQLFLEKEIVAIKEGLDAASRSKQFEFIVKTKITMTDLRRAMLNESPQIVHFSGHGAGEQGILLEGDSGKTQLVSSDALAGLFELFAETLECVVLNACYSATQADAIARHIPYVIGMSGAISDGAACEFAVAFYDALGAGKDIPFAHKLACNAIQMAGIKEHLLPVLLPKSNATPQTAAPQSPRPAAAPSEDIKAKIRELLMSVASLHTQKGRSGLIQSARLDPMLIAQLDADQPLVTFVPNTVATLANYGILNDGRHALEAILTAARALEGQAFQQQCDAIFSEWLGRAPEAVSAVAPKPSSLIQKMERERLEKEFAHYKKQYDAVSQQKLDDLNAMHQAPLQNQLDQLTQKMQEIEQQLARLQ